MIHHRAAEIAEGFEFLFSAFSAENKTEILFSVSSVPLAKRAVSYELRGANRPLRGLKR